MRVILFFSLILIFLGGCGKQPTPRIQYIKNECPELIVLKKIPQKYYPTDKQLKIEDKGDYFLVKKKDLIEASKNCQMKSILIEKQQKYINFYEKQIQKVRKQCRSK